MPIDASIPLSFRPPQAPDQLNQLAQITQIRGMQQKADEYQRSVDDQNQLRASLSAPGADPYTALLRAGRVKEAGEYQKSQDDRVKSQAEADSKRVETEHKAIGIYRDASQAIMDPQSAVAFVTTMHTDPRLKDSAIARVPLEQLLAQIPQDAAQLPAWKQQFALGAAKFMELNKPQFVTSNTGGKTVTNAVAGLTGDVRTVNEMTNTQSPDNKATNDTSRANNAATVGATIRGQNMVDARTREANAQGKTQIVETPQGFVLVDKSTGQARPTVGTDGKPVQGKSNDRVLTDSQAKANLFGTRMKESDRILSSLEGKYMPGAVNAKMTAGEIPGIGGVAGYAGNLMLSEAGQQAEQAQRDFINAVLRRESGAAIAPSEFSNAQKQYFPQSGDTPAVLAQKARNRKLAISGLEAEVPAGFRTSSPSLTSTGQQGGASGDFGGGWSIQKVN